MTNLNWRPSTEKPKCMPGAFTYSENVIAKVRMKYTGMISIEKLYYSYMHRTWFLADQKIDDKNVLCWLSEDDLNSPEPTTAYLLRLYSQEDGAPQNASFRVFSTKEKRELAIYKWQVHNKVCGHKKCDEDKYHNQKGTYFWYETEDLIVDRDRYE